MSSIADVGTKNAKLKWDWTGNVSRMHPGWIQLTLPVVHPDPSGQILLLGCLGMEGDAL